MLAREPQLICACTFSIEIDIQIIAYSLASTPSRLMCLDRHTSSNFIIITVVVVVIATDVKCVYFLFLFTSFLKVSLFFVLIAHLTLFAHSLNGAF